MFRSHFGLSYTILGPEMFALRPQRVVFWLSVQYLMILVLAFRRIYPHGLSVVAMAAGIQNFGILELFRLVAVEKPVEQ